MDRRYSLRENWSLQPKRKSSLDFSRHLCDGARQRTSMEIRPSKSFSATDAIGPMRQFKANNGDSKRQKVLLMGLTSLGRGPNVQMYHMDTKFHRKYGNKDEVDESVASAQVLNRSCVNSPTSSLYLHTDDDDCARSCCDSVSSIACSHFTNVHGLESERQEEKRNILSDEVTKFNSIESWLQGLSK